MRKYTKTYFLNISKSSIRILLFVSLIIFSFIVFFVTLFQYPLVQTSTIKLFIKQFNNSSNYNIDVRSVNLTWFDELKFENISVTEANDSLLCHIEHVDLDFSFSDFWNDGILIVEQLDLYEPDVHLIKYNDSTQISFSEFIKSLRKVAGRKNNETKRAIAISSVSVYNGSVSYNNLTKANITSGMDYYHFKFDSINASLIDFCYFERIISFHSQSLHAKHHDDQLNILSFEGNFEIAPHYMLFDDFELLTDKSLIRDEIVFFYDNFSSLSYFTDSVRFDLRFTDSKVHSDELSLFNQRLSDLDLSLSLDGRVNGGVKDFAFSDVSISLSDSTLLNLDGNIVGLPKLDKTFVDLDVFNSTFDISSVSHLIDSKTHHQLGFYGLLQVNGHYKGSFKDYDVAVNISSKLGSLHSSLTYNPNQDSTKYYSGRVELDTLDLSPFGSDVVVLGKSTASFIVNGNELFDFEKANFDYYFHVDSLALNDYSYEKIGIHGYYSNHTWVGTFSAHDKFLNGSGNFLIQGSTNRYSLDADISKFNLRSVGFHAKDIILESDIRADFFVQSSNSLTGSLHFYNNNIQVAERFLDIDSLAITSRDFGDSLRSIHIWSKDIDGVLKGNYRNDELVELTSNLLTETQLALQNDSLEILNYYQSKVQKNATIDVDLELNLLNANRIFQPFFPSFQLSDSVTIFGHIDTYDLPKVQLGTSFHHISLLGHEFFDNEININLSKQTDSSHFFSDFDITSSSQVWFGNQRTSNAFFHGNWVKDQLISKLSFDQKRLNNSVYLDFKTSFENDSTLIQITNARLELLGDDWKFNPLGRVFIEDDNLLFRDISFTNANQYFGIDGELGSNTSRLLHIVLENFDLKNTNGFMNNKISGNLSADVDITADVNKPFEGDFTVEHLSLNDFLLGEIHGHSTWDATQKHLSLSTYLSQFDKEIIQLNGNYSPNKNAGLDLSLSLNNTPLQLVEPFLKDNFSEVEGLINGSFDIKGNVELPEMYGNALVSSGLGKINYLNTIYSFDGEIVSDKNIFKIKNVLLSDQQNNTGIMSGDVRHKGFKEFEFNVNTSFSKFHLLNTSSNDNDSFYGNAYGSGSLLVSGPLDQLLLKANIASTTNTDLYVPLDNLSSLSIEDKEYIKFAKPVKDSTLIGTSVFGVKNNKQRDFLLDFDIELNNDAQLQLVFDAKSGDIIKGNGIGNLNLVINNEGDFNIFGDYEITNGTYNFTLFNIINKEFDIQKGGTISWYGDPYGAQMNILAKYKQQTSLAPLLNNLDPNLLTSSELRRKYPSVVDLKLNGGLLSPSLAFDIEVTDYPTSITVSDNTIVLQDAITAFTSRIDNNEQEMNRQVFSLIVLRSFAPENSFEINSQSLGNSLSEFVSNQLSYWATQVDENLEVDMDLSSLDQDALDNFNLQLAYTFLDGRLKVSREGGLSNNQDATNNNSIIGDWTVEYLLTKDGRIRAKVYNRTDQDATGLQADQNNMEAGFSLQFVKSFDKLKQIFGRAKKE